MIIALIGNQNCGKTTLFNQLTGSNQHVGNFPGVTVEKKSGLIKKRKDELVDLPGIYSLSPYTFEEIVTRDFLINEKPDVVINIADATNIERNLYLTLQLLELRIPTVLALNMMDEMRQSGSTVNIEALSKALGIPVVPISASKNEGLAELLNQTIKLGETGEKPPKVDFCGGEVHKAIHAIAHIIEPKAKKRGIPVRFAASKLVEGDELIIGQIGLTVNEKDILGHIVDEMEQVLGTDREAALADERYNFITALCSEAVRKNGESREQQRSVKLDRILTNKYAALPIFFGIMFLIFWLTFDVLGASLSELLGLGIDKLTVICDKALVGAGVNESIRSLVIDGVFAGVGSVLSFLPTIVVLFMFLSLLEDSGYMARVAFVMDKLLRKIGLSGRSIVPMLIGFGCSVPAIMATRTIPGERDRKLTLMLIPFISCSAKLPVYALVTAAFFAKNAAAVMIGLYILGIAVGIGSALLLRHTVFKGKPVPFVMELPAYRFPSPKSVALHLWEKTKDFLVKAFTIIFISTIVIWLLQNFDSTFNLVKDSSESLLAAIGKAVSPIFKPLGFSDWRAATALISGLTAKEAVVSTVEVLTGGGASAMLGNPAAGLSFLTFVLLYTPCVAAIAAMKRELGGRLKVIAAIAYQIGVAYVVSLVVYRIACAII